MTEALQTRTEHSRSLEDAEKYRAIETLKEVGLLIPVSELETFHGRVGTKEEVVEWAVDPSFANGSNDSGNYNVNKRPTLYTGEEQVAKDFAVERARDIIYPVYNKLFEDKVRNYTPEERQEWLERENKRAKEWWDNQTPDERKIWAQKEATVYTLDDLEGRIFSEAIDLEDRTPREEIEALWESVAQKYRAEVHEIVTADRDATVFDFSFDESKLDDEAREKYRQALRALIVPITEGSPVSWDDRDAVAPFVEVVRKSKKHLILQSEVGELAAEAGVKEDVALQLASAYNSLRTALINPSYLVSQLIKHSEDIITDSLEVDGKREELPVNLEYVQRYLRKAHIVGARQSVNSATLNRNITSVSFFDLEKTTTVKGLESERQAVWQRLGGIATELGSVMHPEVEQKQSLLKLLEDVHVKPEKLVEAAKLVEGYEDIFNGDAGNWEGFTLAEHTETVLRNFDESYAENLPVELLAPMRLAILAHDVGKPIASARGEKYRQKEYNVAQANDFLSKLGVGERLKDLLLAVIGDGEDLAFQIEIRGAGEPAIGAMRELAINTLRTFTGSEEVTDEQINGFTEMCKMLQVCDGGAYTSMAITRRESGTGRHRNAPSFNSSFSQPVDFGKRIIQLRGEDDKPASHDLTPKVAENQSRLRISDKVAGRKAPKVLT